jgi:hypothetical protein
MIDSPEDYKHFPFAPNERPSFTVVSGPTSKVGTARAQRQGKMSPIGTESREKS